MATSEKQDTGLCGAGCDEKSISRVQTFDELSMNEQIQKLRYELQCAARAISRIGNESAKLRRHEHGSNGNVVIEIADGGREFTADRSEFLK